jgi:hypothetical protein
MGKSPDEIEAEIRKRREFISQRIAAVQDRLHSSVDTLTSDVKGGAASAVEGAKDKLDLSAQMEQHPFTMIAGPFATGVVLGVATDPGAGSMPHRSSDNTSSGSRGRSMLGDLAASVFGIAGDVMQEELQQMLRDGLTSMTGGRDRRQAA